VKVGDVKEGRPKCPWTGYWDETEQHLYYLHEDGRSSWQVPAEGEFWK